MSLTTLLETKTSRAFFRRLEQEGSLRPPPLPRGLPVLVPRGSCFPGRMGHAFDHAMRLSLCRRFGGSFHALAALGGALRMGPDHATRMQEVVAELNAGDTPELSRDEARQCFMLAGWETVFRTGKVAYGDLTSKPDHLDELFCLLEIVPWPSFAPRRSLVFGVEIPIASAWMDGAEPDLVVDDLLLEVKTVDRPILDARARRQLAAYAALINAYGIKGEPREPPLVRQFGLYLSRTGTLASWPLRRMLEDDAEWKIVRFLIEFADRRYWRAPKRLCPPPTRPELPPAPRSVTEPRSPSLPFASKPRPRSES